MGIGALNAVPVVQARAEAARLKAIVRSGADPLELRDADKALKLATANADREIARRTSSTFRVVAAQHIAAQEAGWSNAKHCQQWTSTLATYAYPAIGDVPVCEIDVQHVLQILQPIWSTKPETASRVRMRIEAILNAAKVMGLRSGENPAIWRLGLEAVLPPISKVRTARHHPAMNWQSVPAFYAALGWQDGMSARALQFAILTAARSGEVRGATWDEVDGESALWSLDAERMKAGRPHRVPLGSEAMALLARLPKIAGCNWIFPGMRNQRLSDMSLSAVLKRMGVKDVTVHGFRSSFRDWAADNSAHHPETVEMALAHSVGSKVERAYRRGDQLEKRKLLMEDWESWLMGQ